MDMHKAHVAPHMVCAVPSPNKLASHKTPDEELASAVRQLFWTLHEVNPHLAQLTLREIQVDWAEVYGWQGGTDPD